MINDSVCKREREKEEKIHKNTFVCMATLHITLIISLWLELILDYFFLFYKGKETVFILTNYNYTE